MSNPTPGTCPACGASWITAEGECLKCGEPIYGPRTVPCAGCGEPVTNDPTFSVMRCTPCGVAAGRAESKARAG